MVAGLQFHPETTMFCHHLCSKICSHFRSKFQTKTVYHSFRPLFIYSRFFGLFPFSFKINVFGEVQHVKLTILDLFWLCLSIAMYSSLMAFVLFGPDNVESDLRSAHSLVLGDSFLFVYGFIMCIISIVMDLINRNRIAWNIQRFEEFDKEVNSIYQ